MNDSYQTNHQNIKNKNKSKKQETSTYYRYLQLGSNLSLDRRLDETVGIRKRNIDFSILAEVLDALVPAEVEVNIMLVGKRKVDSVDLGNILDKLSGNVVHGSLDRGRALEGKDTEGSVAGLVVSIVEKALVGIVINVSNVGKALSVPLPSGIDVSGENTVSSFLKSGVVANIVAVKHRAGGL